MSAPAKAAVLPASTTAILSGDSSLFGEFSAPIGFSDTSRQAVSQDGRFVAFTSDSDGLSDQDSDSVDNVYVKDMATGAVTFVSRRSGADGEPSHNNSSDPVISDDGTRVAFKTSASLDPADTNGRSDIYVRDLTTGQTILVSRASGDGAVGTDDSEEPSINADGTKIAFVSTSPNLAAGSRRKVFVADTSAHTTTLVSGPQNTTDPANSDVVPVTSISDDGNKVAFASAASNLVTGDTNNVVDVFVHTVSTGATVLASRATGDSGALGNGTSTSPQISGDGSAVVFISEATTLAPTLDSDNGEDAYKRTLTGTPTTSLVDVKGTTKADRGAGSVAVDDTGNVIGFQSFATNLDPAVAGPDDQSEIYVTTNGGDPVLASRASGAAGAPATEAEGVSVSGDGLSVGFLAGGTVTADALSRVNTIDLRSLAAQTTTLVSRPPGTDPIANDAGDSFGGAVSANGHFVAFGTNARGLGVPAGVDSAIVVRNTVTGAITIASRADGPGGAPMDDAQFPSISADGTRVAFEEDPRTGNDSIWVRDLTTNQTFRVDRASGVGGDPANSGSFSPSIDAAGDKVAFESIATNLSPDDTDTLDDVFVRDVNHSTTTLASRAAHGDKGDDGSGSASLSADGDHVAFASLADNLGDGDTDKTTDIHVRDLAEGTTRLASVSSSGQKGDVASGVPSISGDGSRVAFQSNATNFGSTQSGVSQIWVHDFRSGQTIGASRADGPGGDFMSTDSFFPLMSTDGRVVAFSSGTGFIAMQKHTRPRGARGFLQASIGYRRDLATSTTSVVSRGPGADGATAPTGSAQGISSDGACISFDALGGLVSSAIGASDYQQVYVRTFGPNCAAPASNPPARDTTAPVLRSVSLTHSRFRVAKAATIISARKIPRGTQLRFTASEASKLTIVIQRAVPGKKVRKGKKRVCKPVHKRPKHGACTALRRRATLTRHVGAGRGRVSLSGRIGKRRMAPGRYRLTITATDGAGNRSKATHRSFTILAG